MTSEKVKVFDKENFDEQVINSEKLVMVDFWAPWCGPCRAVGPVVDEIANEYDGKVTIGKLNVDEQGEIAARYRIMSIPTMLFFKKGEVVEKVVGARTKEELKKILDLNM